LSGKRLRYHATDRAYSDKLRASCHLKDGAGPKWKYARINSQEPFGCKNYQEETLRVMPMSTRSRRNDPAAPAGADPTTTAGVKPAACGYEAGGDWVVLVDEDDATIGVAEKLPVHRLGYLHRAISVSLTDGNGRILLQRRAHGKYHSGGLWSNACCSHPRPGEVTLAAAERRLREEMGIVCTLRSAGRVRYSGNVGGGLVENELVHFFRGIHSGRIEPNEQEVCDFSWVSGPELAMSIELDPDSYSIWFRKYLLVGILAL
jgi:isopentenyl-diphosphate delta-isomerase